MSEKGGAVSSEQEGQIGELYGRLDQVDFYELLGISRTADKKEIKRAYNECILRFHPDRFFGRPLGGLKAKLEAIVARLNYAHEVLCSAEARADYDARLPSPRASRIEAMLEESAAEMRRSEATGKREKVVLDPTVTVGAGSIGPPRSNSGSSSHPPSGESSTHPPASGVVARAITPSDSFPPTASRPPASRTPSFSDVFAQFRTLHEQSKVRVLQGDEAASYAQLREDFARTMLAAQQIALKPGQSSRQALRIPCALKLKVAVASASHDGLTVDVSVGGFAGLIGKDVPAGTPCEFVLHLPRQPVIGRGRVVGSERHRGSTNLLRVSVAFELLDAATTERIERFVIDKALASLKT